MDIYIKNIKPLLDRSGLTDVELEKEIGLPAKTIYKWNSGLNKSYIKYAPQIAAFFGVSVDSLIGKTDIKNKPLAQDGKELTERQKKYIDKIDQMTEEEFKLFEIFMNGLGK